MKKSRKAKAEGELGAQEVVQVEVQPKSPKPSPEQIPFELFFAKCVNEGRLKPWQHDEIQSFFREMRLRDKEDLETYEEFLARY